MISAFFLFYLQGFGCYICRKGYAFMSAISNQFKDLYDIIRN